MGDPPPRRLMLAVVAGAVLVLGLMPSAQASESAFDVAVDQLVALQPDMTRAEAVASVTADAAANHVDSTALARAEAAQLRESVTQNRGTVGADGKVHAESSSVKATLKFARQASNRGDVLYTPSSTAGVNHGHSAVFDQAGVLSEAPGVGKRARTVNYANSSYNVSKGAKMGYVRVFEKRKKDTKKHWYLAAASTRQAAVTWAYSRTTHFQQTKRGKVHLLGDAYNKDFAHNTVVVTAALVQEGKKGKTEKENCSQLVWASYKRLGINFNTNEYSRLLSPGNWTADELSVMPYEIRGSKYVKNYVTIDGQKAADPKCLKGHKVHGKCRW